MDVADAVAGSELILLCIEPDPPAWELRRPRRLRTGTKQIISRARSTVAARGIQARTRLERGEKGDVVTRVAAQETCDQIFVAEPAVRWRPGFVWPLPEPLPAGSLVASAAPRAFPSPLSLPRRRADMFCGRAQPLRVADQP